MILAIRYSCTVCIKFPVELLKNNNKGEFCTEIRCQLDLSDVSS